MPPCKLPVLESKAHRYHMVLARSREDGVASPNRPVHIVPVIRIKDRLPDRRACVPKTLEEITNITPWQAYCGTLIASAEAELVAWGSEFEIHDECVRNSSYVPSFVKRVLREARDMELRYGGSTSEEDMDSSIATMNVVFAARDRDWVCDDEGDWWTYEASFGGAFPGDLIQPREADIGLERLTVQIPFPGTVYVHSCGVRDGCPKHISHTTKFSLKDLDAIEKSLSMHEAASTLFDLTELALCLVRGDCAKIPVYC